MQTKSASVVTQLFPGTGTPMPLRAGIGFLQQGIVPVGIDLDSRRSGALEV
jgi:hypothetical protein